MVVASVIRSRYIEPGAILAPSGRPIIRAPDALPAGQRSHSRPQRVPRPKRQPARAVALGHPVDVLVLQQPEAFRLNRVKFYEA